MDERFNDEFRQNYENAEIMFTLFFAFIDFVIIIFSLINLKSKNKKIYMLKYKLFTLIIADIVSRILYSLQFYKEIRLYKNVFFLS